MKKLTTKEEEIMQIVWRRKVVFIRDIVEGLPSPEPHYNTVATLVKILVRKGFLFSKMIGNTHQYSPAIDLEDYRKEHLVEIKKRYFENSFPKMLTFFAKEEDLDQKQIDELVKIIKSKNT